MLSLRAWYVLLSIPIKLLVALIKYPFFGGINERYRNNLRLTLKLQLYRTALSIPVKDAHVISILSSYFLINKMIKSLYPSLTRGLNKYGQRYDKQSIWLVEATKRSKDDPILIFLHGGGYYLEAMPEQMQSVLSIYHLLEPKKRDKLSVLHLDYKLASRGHYVTSQLYQFAETYEALTARDGNTNIILMGDSAGGHIAITFLQHLKQQQKKALPWPTSLVLISPWVKLHPEPHQGTKGWSYYENSKRDIIQYRFFQEKNRQVAIIGAKNHKRFFSESGQKKVVEDPSHLDMLISPGNHPYSYSDWDDIPTLNDAGHSVFVVLGEHEVFRDDILEWCQYAVKSPLIKQKLDSGGVVDAKIHEYADDEKLNGAYINIEVEPWGVHDAALFMENDIASKLQKNPHLKLSNLDRKEYFGIVHICEFLNKVL
ncbi:uncharacterized protein LODBEIA_P55560 [Lodderomyces beijingensis]|uniref:Alpha/beta hydrolase fold-3 domain-containing protein n=1 Tax=Lodderomyces beijingensis TaxID=1775926 RepID=A0ABP0ZV78_9ASCO